MNWRFFPDLWSRHGCEQDSCSIPSPAYRMGRVHPWKLSQSLIVQAHRTGWACYPSMYWWRGVTSFLMIFIYSLVCVYRLYIPAFKKTEQIYSNKVYDSSVTMADSSKCFGALKKRGRLPFSNCSAWTYKCNDCVLVPPSRLLWSCRCGSFGHISHRDWRLAFHIQAPVWSEWWRIYICAIYLRKMHVDIAGLFGVRSENFYQVTRVYLKVYIQTVQWIPGRREMSGMDVKDLASMVTKIPMYIQWIDVWGRTEESGCWQVFLEFDSQFFPCCDPYIFSFSSAEKKQL